MSWAVALGIFKLKAGMRRISVFIFIFIFFAFLLGEGVGMRREGGPLLHKRTWDGKGKGMKIQ